MTDVLKIIAVCTVALIGSLFLKQYKSEFALIVTLCGAIVVAIFILDDFLNVKQGLEDILTAAKVDAELLKTIFKALAICFVTSFSSCYCKDFGHSLLASKIELAGRVAVVSLTLPTIKRIVEMALELIG